MCLPFFQGLSHYLPSLFYSKVPPRLESLENSHVLQGSEGESEGYLSNKSRPDFLLSLAVGLGVELVMWAYIPGKCNSVLTSEAQRQAFHAEHQSLSCSQSFMSSLFLLSWCHLTAFSLQIFPKQRLIPLCLSPWHHCCIFTPGRTPLPLLLVPRLPLSSLGTEGSPRAGFPPFLQGPVTESEALSKPGTCQLLLLPSLPTD